MDRWTGRLVILGAFLYFGGYVVLVLSGHGGDSGGGSELAWTTGGLMVYVAFPTFALALITEIVTRLRHRFGSVSG